MTRTTIIYRYTKRRRRRWASLPSSSSFLNVILVCLLMCRVQFCSAYNISPSLECKPSTTDPEKLDCQFSVTQQELSDAWGMMHCETTHDGGLNCRFTINRDSSNTDDSKSLVLQDCSSGTCVVLAATASSYQSRDQAEDHPTTTAANGVEDMVMDDGLHTEEVIVDEPAESNTENKEQYFFTGLVGNYVYEKPYHQYTPHVANVLSNLQATWVPNSRNDITAQFMRANLLVKLGAAHVQLEPMQFPDSFPENKAAGKELELAMNALKEAEKLYNDILARHPIEEKSILPALASVYFNMGEAYSVGVQTAEERRTMEKMSEYEALMKRESDMNDAALRYYFKAQEMYEKTLERVQYSEDEGVDIEVGLAHTCHRIGSCIVKTIDATGAVASVESWMEQLAGGDNPFAAEIEKKIPLAAQNYEKAIQIFRGSIEKKRAMEDKVHLRSHLATTLQDYSTSVSYSSDFIKALQLQEEAIAVNQENLSYLTDDNLDFAIQFIGDGLYSLSSHYLQLGKYEEALSNYEKAMNWYEKYSLQATLDLGAEFLGTDESLEVYEQQLAEYNELVREIKIPDGYVDPNGDQVVYEPNDAYEGDLHAALGASHLARNEVAMAQDHFQQALRLYDNYSGDDSLERSIADVKMNLAVAYYKNGEFRQSIDAHSDALEIYRRIVGEGKNPLLAGFGDMSEFGFPSGGLGGAADFNAQTGSMNENVLGNAEAREQDMPKDQPAVHEGLIDLERYRESILNETEDDLKSEL